MRWGILVKTPTKIFDVVQPKDNWSRNYAHLEYLHTGLKQTFSTKINVHTHEFLPKYGESDGYETDYEQCACGLIDE